MTEKAAAFAESFQESVERLETALAKESSSFSDQESARKTLEERKALLDQLVEKYSTADDGARESGEVYEVLEECGSDFIADDDCLEMALCVHLYIASFEETVEPLRKLGGYEPYLRDLEFYLAECRNDKKEFDLFLEEGKAREALIDAFNERRTAFEADVEAYHHSGFFGGVPTFDFSGKRACLEQRAQAIDQEADRLNAQLDEIVGRFTRIIGSAADKNREFADRFRSLAVDLQQHHGGTCEGARCIPRCCKRRKARRARKTRKGCHG